ncbi:MAG: cytochrome d ubiquinol oxidase subunit II [Candidatus Hodarchaeales archaeon]|jgi:cytochrome d ubiquinol oxidase subunit II
MAAPTEIQLTWFLVIGILFAAYAILDGFDLGIGFWYLLTRNDEDRRTLLNAIGPLWDGNEVWLIAAAGGLFAAFPLAYATVFSSLYLAVMVVMWALIFRAVSIEFRSQLTSRAWRNIWDFAFAIASILLALLLAVAMGNVLHGLPLDNSKNFNGEFLDLLNPYALLVGLLGLAMFATHGALYLTWRTNDPIATQAKQWAFMAWIAYLALFIIVSLFTIIDQDHLVNNFEDNLLLWVVPLLGLVAILLIGGLQQKDMYFFAFIASAASIALLLAIAGVSLYPNIVPALDADLSISIKDAASSDDTLTVMLMIALIGMPLVLIYTAWMYKIFVSEKVTLGADSY